MAEKYRVNIQEVHSYSREYVANSEQEAIEQAAQDYAEACFDEMYLEYSHTLSQDTWTVENLGPTTEEEDDVLSTEPLPEEWIENVVSRKASTEEK